MTIERCIGEQPEVLEAVLAEVPPQLAALAPLRLAGPITLVGSGSSMNALVAVEPLLDRLVPAGVRIRGPLAFLAEVEGRRGRKGIAIFLSQTGVSTTTVEAVTRARVRGMRTLTLTAERQSPIGSVSGELGSEWSRDTSPPSFPSSSPIPEGRWPSWPKRVRTGTSSWSWDRSGTTPPRWKGP